MWPRLTSVSEGSEGSEGFDSMVCVSDMPGPFALVVPAELVAPGDQAFPVHEWSKMRILVADDDEDCRELIAMALRAGGTEIVFATTRGELVEQIVDHGPFDVIITDINMPGVTGLEVLEVVRKADASTPVLVITALAHPDPTEPVARMGNSWLLHKPFGIDQLRAAIDRLRAR